MPWQLEDAETCLALLFGENTDCVSQTLETDSMFQIDAYLTLGYQINDNLGLTFNYKSTASDQAPDDLQMGVFMISLVSGWHPPIQGSKRLKE